MIADSKKSPRPTIRDAANHIGVSTATISNAFNHPDQLSPELRERILSECLQLGYRSSGSPRKTDTTGSQGVIGIVLPDCLSHNLNDSVANQFLNGVTTELESQHLSMLLIHSRELSSTNQVRRLQSSVDGFIVYGHIEDDAIFDQLTLQSKKLIAVDCSMSGHSSVASDNFGGAFNSADLALQHHPEYPAILGLRIIDSKYVCRVYNDNDLFADTISVAVRRLNGYREALSKHNMILPNERIWHIPDNTEASALLAVREALQCTPRPDAFFCMTDTYALTAIKEATRIGIRIPEELKIVGFDGIPESLSSSPSLTTVKQDNFAKGKIAASLFTKPPPPIETILATELLIRESCPMPEPSE